MALAERTAEAMRGAIREGVVPGEGVAYLACSQVLHTQLSRTTNLDECSAYRILIESLREPVRTVLFHAEYDSGEMMAEIVQAGPGNGVDLNRRQVVNMSQSFRNPALLAKMGATLCSTPSCCLP